MSESKAHVLSMPVPVPNIEPKPEQGHSYKDVIICGEMYRVIPSAIHAHGYHLIQIVQRPDLGPGMVTTRECAMPSQRKLMWALSNLPPGDDLTRK